MGVDFQGHEEEALELLLQVDSSRHTRRMEVEGVQENKIQRFPRVEKSSILFIIMFSFALFSFDCLHYMLLNIFFLALIKIYIAEWFCFLTMIMMLLNFFLMVYNVYYYFFKSYPRLKMADMA